MMSATISKHQLKDSISNTSGVNNILTVNDFLADT